MTSSLKSNKRALRKAITTSLRTLTPGDIQSQSQSITALVLSSPFFNRCRSVSCYLSMPSGEVDTSSLVSHSLRAGKTLFVPKITNGRMELLKVYGEEDLKSFPSGIWGIKEPSLEWQGQKRQSVQDEECEGLDLILLPGLAFDRSLGRLGHGKGYYDTFLSSHIANCQKPPLLVALSLREQLLESGQVPVDDHDWKMDLIVTPHEIIPTGCRS